MRKWITNGLLVGAITLVVGATVSLVMPSGGSGLALAGGTVGAIAATVLSRRQDQQAKTEILQELRRLAKTVDELQSQITHAPDLDSLQASFKQLQAQVELACQSSQVTTETITELRQVFENLSPLATKRLSRPRSTTSQLTHGEGTGNLDVLQWLAKRHVQVIGHRQPGDADQVYDRLALYLGERYPSLSTLLKKIKISLQTGGRFRLNLLDKPQVDVANCTQFCRMLKDDSFLSYYYYSPADKLIQAAPQRNFTNFFNGDWFERFVYLKVCSLLKANGLQYQCLVNPDIILANTNKFGLDLFFLIDQQPLWLECKTGQDYTAFLERYASHRKAIGIPKERAFVVILDITEAQTIDLTNLWDLTVVNRDNFLEVISQNLNLVLPEELTLVNYGVGGDHNFDKAVIAPGKLATFLRKQNLRPLPEDRPVVIQELIKLFQDDITVPTTLTEVKAILGDRLQHYQDMSNLKLHQILKAIAQGGCLLDQAGEVITLFNLPVSRLVSLDPSEIEYRCYLSYVATILEADSEYFYSPEKTKEFLLVVGINTITETQLSELISRGTSLLERQRIT